MQFSKEDELLRSKIEDMADQVRHKNVPKFSFFLDEHQAHLAESVIRKHPDLSYAFFGGFEGAVRKMLGVFPDFMPVDLHSFPIAGLQINYREGDSLTHRDFLGSFMALGVKREILGDIIVGEGQAVVCLYKKQFGYFIDNIQKIGKVGVTLNPYDLDSVKCSQSFKEISGSVASMRLDAILTLVLRISRGKAADIITAGLVSLNYEEITSVSTQLKIGDVFSVRGHGKYTINKEPYETKKGRLWLTIDQYV